MKLVASIDLARRPLSLIQLPGGALLLHSSDEGGTFLEAYDPDLASIWSVRLGGRPIEFTWMSRMLLARDGTPWVLDRVGASAIGLNGTCIDRQMPKS